MPPIKKTPSKTGWKRPARTTAVPKPARTGKPRNSIYGRAEPAKSRSGRDTTDRGRARTDKPRAAEYGRSESTKARPVRGAGATTRVRAEKPRASETVRAEPAKAKPLTASQKRYLRSLAHDLKAVILVGQKGVTAALLAEFAVALEHHELVKVKLADDDRESRAASVEQIREHAGAELVQSIGKVACFYKRNPDRNQFTLPK